MPAPAWTADLLRAVDTGDTDAFLGFLTDEPRFVFGNAPAIEGRDALREVLDGFFASIDHSEHEIIEGWEVDDAVIIRGRVTYFRLDGSTYTVPFANVFKLEGGQIRDYL
ncbi:MAG: nuclear transport factor 2 family protein, partial [Rhodothermales bacterium]|nr:nuclear transport factor 2 family protein [Rhodothermales bacterium]